jgi:hypothetical protein
MTIEHTVDIPTNRRITIEVPPQIPTGRTNVIIQFPVSENTQPKNTILKDNNGENCFTKETIDEMLQDCPHTRALTGILSGMGDVDLDEIRMERLSKHLK